MATTPTRSGRVRQNSMPSCSPSLRMSVVTKYVPCGSYTSKPMSRRPGRNTSRWAQVIAEPGVVLVGQGERLGHCVLERAAADVSKELLGRLYRGHQLGRRLDPADLPASERERLARRADRHRPLAHAGEPGDRQVLAVED